MDYKLELIKNKGIHEQSAIASFEVKKRLQEFVLQKKKREAATATSSGKNLILSLYRYFRSVSPFSRLLPWYQMMRAMKTNVTRHLRYLVIKN